MDVKSFSVIFKGTIDPNQRVQAEEKLSQMYKIIGFSPTVLQMVMSTEIEMPVRQAGAIYLKNMINQNWEEIEPEPGVPPIFHIHEQDRSMIRSSIIEAVIHAPDLIRAQLAACVKTIVKHDFPGRWTEIVDKISIFLQQTEADKVLGALICLLQLVKNFEYKKREERAPLNEAMLLLLPMIYNLLARLLPDESEQSVIVQKYILKIYYALIQFLLPFEIITQEIFSQWLAILVQVIERPVPPTANTEDEEERSATPWWKCKKIAAKILYRVFERYGSPSNVPAEYKEFSKWYLKTFSEVVLNCFINLLHKTSSTKEYITSEVLKLTLNYLKQALSHAHSWSILKNHMFGIIQEVIFPLLCHNDADEELWESDPLEYIRVNYDSYTECLSHRSAAQDLLHSACMKRKQILPKTVQLVMHFLTTPNVDNKVKDGCLYTIGAIADILFKKELYKDQMETMIGTYVFPEINSNFGFLRARALWTLSQFSEMKFHSEQVLNEAVKAILNALLNDKELRVKVQACMSLYVLLTNHNEEIAELIRPQVQKVILEVLTIIRETKNDEITNLLQNMITTYEEEIGIISYEVCTHLETTLSQMLDNGDASVDNEYSLSIMSLLNTLETVAGVLKDEDRVFVNIRPIMLRIVVHIIQKDVLEFYEEAFSILYELNSKQLIPELWQTLEIIYEAFQRDGAEYFVEMMPCLYNYITVDTNQFLSNENYLLAIFNMCKTILNTDSGVEAECHAAKLLEVIILQCKGRIDQCIPSFMELVLQRLTRDVKASELRILCLQVIIAALYYNPQLFFEILNKLQLAISSTDSITSHFIRQWIHDTDCFLGLHDRKMCVLGLCTLLMLHPERPQVLNECVQQIVPSLILLFSGLKRAYAIRAQENAESDSEEEEEESEEDDYQEVLSSDEDEIVDGDDYLVNMKDRIKEKSKNSGFPIDAEIQDDVEFASGNDDDDDEDDDDDYDPNEQTQLESYTTPIDEDEIELDEYVLFKNVLIGLKDRDPSFYDALTNHLTAEQQKQLQEIIILADQRVAAAESKKIEQAGGYTFSQQSVPSSFNFSGSKC